MNLLVVGDPRSGKTRWCTDYIDWVREHGVSVGGVLSPEVCESGERLGFDVTDLITGKRIPYARLSINDSFGAGETVGPYTIDHDAILFARKAIRSAIDSVCGLVVIDEFGPLELRGKGLMPEVELALSSALNVLIVVRSSLWEAIQRYFIMSEFATVDCSTLYDLEDSLLHTSYRGMLPCGYHS
jgi:nucleoside-triphosphatase THEP1